jgi:outer membrane protein assembly factor BamB
MSPQRPTLHRRELLAGVGGLTAASATAGCLGLDLDGSGPSPGTDDSTDWPERGNGPAGRSYAPDALAPRSGTSQRWTTEVPWITDRPVVAEGLVLLPTAGPLVAYDTASGDEVWRYTPDVEGQPWFHSPAVRDGTVFATFREERGLVALSAADGSLRWRADVGPVSAPPLPVEDGSVPSVFVGDRRGRLTLLDDEGDSEWSDDLFGEVTTLHAPDRGLGQQAYVGTSAGEVYAMYDDGGSPRGLWRRKLGGKVLSLAIERGGDAYVSTFGGPTVRLRGGAHTGRTDWSNEQAGTLQEGLCAVDGRLYGANLASLNALDTRDGERAWTVDVGSDVDFTCGPVAAGDTLYVGRSGAVVGYKLGGGVGVGESRLEARRFHHAVEGSPASIAVADGALFVAVESSDGPSRLLALDPA